MSIYLPGSVKAKCSAPTERNEMRGGFYKHLAPLERNPRCEEEVTIVGL